MAAGAELEDAQLVVYDEDALNLILVANSEYKMDVTKAEQQIAWELKREAFESDVVERSVILHQITSNARCTTY